MTNLNLQSTVDHTINKITDAIWSGTYSENRINRLRGVIYDILLIEDQFNHLHDTVKEKTIKQFEKAIIEIAYKAISLE